MVRVVRIEMSGSCRSAPELVTSNDVRNGRRLRLAFDDAQGSNGAVGLAFEAHDVIERAIAVPHEAAASKLSESGQLRGAVDFHLAQRRKLDVAQGRGEQRCQFGDALPTPRAPIEGVELLLRLRRGFGVLKPLDVARDGEITGGDLDALIILTNR